MHFKPILKGLQKRLPHILVATLTVVGLLVVLLSWKIVDLSRANLQLSSQQKHLFARLTVQPIEIEMRPASIVEDLPRFGELEQVVVDTQSLFEQAGLLLRDATHTPQLLDTESKSGKVEITVHGKGEYRAIKKAIANLLEQHEEVALQSLALSRERSTESALQFEARFTFFHRVQK
jgi:Tfp pilus assembly protein PilO